MYSKPSVTGVNFFDEKKGELFDQRMVRQVGTVATQRFNIYGCVRLRGQRNRAAGQ